MPKVLPVVQAAFKMYKWKLQTLSGEVEKVV